MRPILRPVALLCFVLALPLSLALVRADDAVKPASRTVAVVPSLDSLGFLAGTWRGVMGEDFVEEFWSAPHGSSMMGAFRWAGADGAPGTFELLTISQEKEVTRLRLRHYSATLVAKEAADKPLTLKLTQSAAARAVFEAEKDAGDLARITYEVAGDQLRITVEFNASEKPREPLRFALKRT
ncbi:MAG: DUF6265 family protein [Phycisphaerae bacterium]|nr:DUF6265 family protein [Phycisphaerae bacterium]